MSPQPPVMPPEQQFLGGHPPKRFLIGLLAAVLLLFLGTLPWQMRNWHEAAAMRRDSVRQQARLQQLEQARDDLYRAQASLRAAPNDPAAQMTIAAALIQNGDFPSAASHLRSLEPAAARSPELADAEAGLYQQIGYIDRAVALARQEMELAPRSPASWLRLGLLDLQVARQAQGQALLLRATHALPHSAEPHLALALLDNQTGDLRRAEQELELADHLRPADWHIAALLADNRLAQHRDAEALQSVADALRLAPQEPTLYAQQARILLDQARTQAAGDPPNIAATVQAARQCLALDPNNEPARETLGLAYRDAGQGAEARREWEQAVALTPDNQPLEYNLGRLCLQQGDRAAGRRLLAQATRAAEDRNTYDRLVGQAGERPDNSNFHRQLARWCTTHHRLSRAIFEWQEVLVLLPQDDEARRTAAQLLTQRG